MLRWRRSAINANRPPAGLCHRLIGQLAGIGRIHAGPPAIDRRRAVGVVECRDQARLVELAETLAAQLALAEEPGQQRAMEGVAGPDGVASPVAGSAP